VVAISEEEIVAINANVQKCEDYSKAHLSYRPRSSHPLIETRSKLLGMSSITIMCFVRVLF
jgi:hypothetical protein